MGKNKLKRFAEMEGFGNTYQFPENMPGTWHEQVFHNQNPIVLDLACGRGEYTVGLSALYPEKNFIAIDVKGARLWRGAKTCWEEQRDNAAFMRARIEQIHKYFAPNEVSEIWITFPDPHLKHGKARKRLSSWYFMREYARISKDGALLHLKTDDDLLYAFTKTCAEALQLPILQDVDPVEINNKNPDLKIITTYEELWRKENKTIRYLQIQLDHAAFEPARFEQAEREIKAWLLEHNPPLPDPIQESASKALRQTKK